MTGPLNWQDTLKATALAALAERTNPTAPNTINQPRTWDAHEVWLSRIQQPREVVLNVAPHR